MNAWTRSVTQLAVLVCVLALAGCATTPQPNPALEDARQTVERAAENPDVNRFAAVELREAREKLTVAEDAWSDRAEQPRVDHLAFLARRQAELAEEAARARRLDQRLDELRGEREQVRLEARAARAERTAQRERTERARAEAERAAEAAERARAEREARMAEEEARYADERRARAEARAAELERQTAEMQAEAERLQQQLAELEARPTERGLVLTLGSDVLFDFDRYELKPGAERTVERIARFLNEYPERQVLVEGFTDSVGSREYNMGLSERRANAVRTALVEREVDPGRIRIRGYGPDYPVASNDSESGRQLNRRVEVIISDDDEAVPERRDQNGD
jgi:outer membrane protein OmpA-like peptidoglycan-associated protein